MWQLSSRGEGGGAYWLTYLLVAYWRATKKPFVAASLTISFILHRNQRQNIRTPIKNDVITEILQNIFLT